MLVVVDAIDDAASVFYEYYRFSRIPDAGRLGQKVSDIGVALGH